MFETSSVYQGAKAFLKKYFMWIVAAFIVFFVFAMFASSAKAEQVIRNEPATFEFTAVTTDTAGDPIDPARVTGYTSVCTNVEGAPSVTLNFPAGTGTLVNPVAPNTFAIGNWNCDLTADDAEGVPNPGVASASFEVTLVVTPDALDAPGGFTVTFSANPQ